MREKAWKDKWNGGESVVKEMKSLSEWEREKKESRKRKDVNRDKREQEMREKLNHRGGKKRRN